MNGTMKIRIWDVQHGACAMLLHSNSSKLAMIDSGHNNDEDWYPSKHIKNVLKRTELDYLFITNADHDHMSDLNGLWKANVNVKTLFRNGKISAADLRAIKQKSAGNAKLSDDIERFLNIHETYIHPVDAPFDSNMGGITFTSFSNSYPAFQNTNDLSLAVFFEYGNFKILFPGDLERAGWLALLKDPKFVIKLAGTNVLVASHHGRENGYCKEIFDHFKPQCVVFSDKPIDHETQKGMSQTYKNHCGGVKLTDGTTRYVLTTRDDGWIHFDVAQNFTVRTEVISG